MMDDRELKAALGRQLAAFFEAYRARTTQLADLDTATRWWRLSLTRPEVTAAVAASWARRGFLPEEAEPLIAAEMMPETAVATDPTTDAERMERLADRMAMLRDTD